MLAVLATDVAAEIVAAKSFLNDVPSVSKWVQAWIRPTYRVEVGPIYRLAVCFIGGHFFRNSNTLLSAPVTNNNITFNDSFQTTSLDIAGTAITTNKNANAVDVLFQPD
jgi:hypothetical protein